MTWWSRFICRTFGHRWSNTRRNIVSPAGQITETHTGKRCERCADTEWTTGIRYTRTFYPEAK